MLGEGLLRADVNHRAVLSMLVKTLSWLLVSSKLRMFEMGCKPRRKWKYFEVRRLMGLMEEERIQYRWRDLSA